VIDSLYGRTRIVRERMASSESEPQVSDNPLDGVPERFQLVENRSMCAAPGNSFEAVFMSLRDTPKHESSRATVPAAIAGETPALRNFRSRRCEYSCGEPCG
jgi:hypothetical protein